MGNQVAAVVVHGNVTKTTRLPNKASIFRAELHAISLALIVSDIAIFVLKRDVKLQLTHLHSLSFAVVKRRILLFLQTLCQAWWRDGATGKAFGLAISRSRVQILLEATLRNNLRQVVYTYVPLS